MKSFKILAFSISFILSIVFFGDHFLSDKNKFSNKEKSKTEAKLYPYEWTYLKKTWP